MRSTTPHADWASHAARLGMAFANEAFNTHPWAGRRVVVRDPDVAEVLDAKLVGGLDETNEGDCAYAVA